MVISSHSSKLFITTDGHVPVNHTGRCDWFFVQSLVGDFYATVATLCSSALSYWIGHVLGRSTIEKHSSHYLRVVSRFMQENSVHSMVVINLLPIAPFTMTNMMAGAFQLKFSRYMIGSAIGIIPGLIVVTLLGGQLNKIVSATDNQQFWGELVIAVTLISVLMAIIRWVKKKEHVDD